MGTAARTVLNLGRVVANFPGPYGNYGVYLQNGTVINGAGTASAAYITAYHDGVKLGVAGSIGSGTLINYGTIYGQRGRAAELVTNGVVINGPSGAIGAQLLSGAGNAIQIDGAGTVINYGTITDRNDGVGIYTYGVSMVGSGTISNLGSASLIAGADGVYAEGNSTVVNAGTIASSTRLGRTIHNAVRFGAGTNRLIVDPGGHFVGTVTAAGTTTLELAAGGSAGTLSSIGSEYTGFAAIAVDAGATWQLASGSIAAGYTITDAGTLTNHATIDSPVTLTAGASMINAPDGLISSSGTAVYASGTTASTVTNFGTIAGGGGYAVLLNAAHSLLTDGAGAVFSGTVADAGGSGTLELTTGTAPSGTLSSFGTHFTGFSTVTVASGSRWVFANSDTIGSSDTVIDSGSLTNSGAISGYLTLTSGTSLTNASGGTITGPGSGTVAAITGISGGIVTNLSGGLIDNTVGAGIVISGTAGQVTNLGSINGYIDGVQLLAGGSVVNGVSGATPSLANIYGKDFGVYVKYQSGTVTNYGTIASETCGCFPADGIYLGAGGFVTNAASATVDGYLSGVFALGAAATVVNTGTISGVASSVYLGASNNLLIDNPGAVFDGKVRVGKYSIATLELTSASSIGTVTGFGTNYIGFSTVKVDSGAQWLMEGGVAREGSVDLIGSSTLTMDGLVTDQSVFFLSNSARLTQ